MIFWREKEISMEWLNMLEFYNYTYRKINVIIKYYPELL